MYIILNHEIVLIFIINNFQLIFVYTNTNTYNYIDNNITNKANSCSSGVLRHNF